MILSLLGGTGPEGSGLGLRWAAAGHKVIVGSRQSEKGERVAAEMKALLPEGNIRGTDNLNAARAAEVVILTVPYEAQEPTLAAVAEALEGKLLITVVAPTRKPKARVWRMPSGLSAAEEAQQQLGDKVRVVAGFQNVGAHNLTNLDHRPEWDVLICGDRKEDKDVVLELCSDAGFRGVNAGALQNASVVEGMTSILIGINIRNKVRDAGIRITGI